MERRKFIKQCCYAGAGVIAGSVLVSCSPIYYAKHTSKGRKLIIAKSEFKYQVGEKEKTRSYVLVQHPEKDFPICIKDNDGSYSALLLMCTHRSCGLDVGGHVYTCPCHGSEFDLKGEVITGPAEEALMKFKTETDEKNIYVQL